MKWSWTGFGGNLVVFTTSSEPEVDFSFLPAVPCQTDTVPVDESDDQTTGRYVVSHRTHNGGLGNNDATGITSR